MDMFPGLKGLFRNLGMNLLNRQVQHDVHLGSTQETVEIAVCFAAEACSERIRPLRDDIVDCQQAGLCRLFKKTLGVAIGDFSGADDCDSQRFIILHVFNLLLLRNQ